MAENEGIEGRILIIDDDSSQRFLLHNMLSHFNYNIDQAEDGNVGFEKIKHALEIKTPYHALLSDVNMPNLDGPDMIFKLRETSVDGYTPTIFITGTEKDYDIKRINEIKPYALIKKPFKLDVLKSSVNEAVKLGKFLYSNYN